MVEIEMLIHLLALGYITTQKARNIFLALCTGYILVGPGASTVGLWYWREGVVASLG